MGTRDARVDAYIAKSALFAQPILLELRATVHEGCPDVEETMKWGMPFFLYKGILCNMSAFKAHCAFGFWKAGRVLGAAGLEASDEAMGQFGRITSVEELPAKRVLLGYVKKVKNLRDEGIKPPTKPKPKKEELVEPDYFLSALKKSKKAGVTYESFSPSKRREYIEWLEDAKSEATRQRRLETALEWMAEGKSRNWKYEKC